MKQRSTREINGFWANNATPSNNRPGSCEGRGPNSQIVGHPRWAETTVQTVGHLTGQPFFLDSTAEQGPSSGLPLGVRSWRPNDGQGIDRQYFLGGFNIRNL